MSRLGGGGGLGAMMYKYACMHIQLTQVLYVRGSPVFSS